MNGSITEDREFFHKKLNEYPAMAATISFEVTHNFSLIRQYDNNVIKMDIYTREKHRNIEKNCSGDAFGQLRNEGLHVPIKDKRYRGTDCSRIGDTTVVTCFGQIRVQDYVPSYFSFSFGFSCDFNWTRTLRGLHYRLSIYSLTNETSCVKVQRGHFQPCSRFNDKFTSFPTLMYERQIYVGQIESALAVPWQALFHTLEPPVYPCHKHMYEILCLSIFPKCEPATGRSEHLCKESCWEVVEACWEAIRALADRYKFRQGTQGNFLQTINIGRLDAINKSTAGLALVNCDYLPSRHSNISCFYKQVFCEEPPAVSNMNITNLTTVKEQDKYPVNSSVLYSCIGENLILVGNDTVHCLYSGDWSETPKM